MMSPWEEFLRDRFAKAFGVSVGFVQVDYVSTSLSFQLPEVFLLGEDVIESADVAYSAESVRRFDVHLMKPAYHPTTHDVLDRLDKAFGGTVALESCVVGTSWVLNLLVDVFADRLRSTLPPPGLDWCVEREGLPYQPGVHAAKDPEDLWGIWYEYLGRREKCGPFHSVYVKTRRSLLTSLEPGIRDVGIDVWDEDNLDFRTFSI